jgi:hypothetical protein
LFSKKAILVPDLSHDNKLLNLNRFFKHRNLIQKQKWKHFSHKSPTISPLPAACPSCPQSGQGLAGRG